VSVEVLDALADHCSSPKGYNELVLRESSWAVESVPVPHRVERVEEARKRLQLAKAPCWRFSIPQFVSRPTAAALTRLNGAVIGTFSDVVDR